MDMGMVMIREKGVPRDGAKRPNQRATATGFVALVLPMLPPKEIGK
jgi:hypothetical protein